MASYAQSAADTVKSAGQTTAEAVKPYAGETVANAIQSAGEYGKAGIEKSAEYMGLKEGVGQVKTLRRPLCALAAAPTQNSSVSLH